jgi:6-phosphogluconolactonase (cycloisomerase 2 family)
MYSKKRPLFILVVTRLCAAAFVAGTPLAAGHLQAATSYVYVESNIGQAPNQNSVFAFSNDGAGKLTPVNESPFLTGGTGVYSPGGPNTEFEADQEVIASPGGKFLYAVNGHSNSIAAFDINSDGTLTNLANSPFPSGGQDPVSVGISASNGPATMVCVNKNEDTGQDIGDNLPNYTTFSVGNDGSLTMNAGSTLNLAAGSSPAQALTTAKDHFMLGIEFVTSRIASYTINRAGILTEISSFSPPANGGGHFLGGAVNSKKRAAYFGLPGANLLGVYGYNGAANLAFRHTVTNNGILPCWVALNAAGTVLFSSETGSGTVSAYTMTNPTRPTLHQQLNLAGAGQAPTNVALDPTEQFLYVLAGDYLHVINLASDGTMSEIASPVVLPVNAGETPLGLVAIQK